MNQAPLFHAVLAASDRTVKPREHGLTIALDTGLGPRGAADLADTAAAHCDFVKIAWGSSLITGNLDAKLDIYRQAGITPMLGGTLFEYSFLQGKLEELFALVRATKIHIEVSDGSIDIPTADKLKWIERFGAVTEVWSEIGGKIALHVKDWGEVLRQEFGAGAKKIVVEGRQVGPVGQPVREGFVDELVQLAGGHDRLIWEALERPQQLFFLKKLGPNVNLANIKTADVLTLESFRRGLKEHTLLTWPVRRGG
ncbi:MAG: phosphosulfolactate synthase [Deltaproteobacteria bacterium]|nr:phosphosulfolactate synthase [Deltaproteobacteria bacterium]